MSQSLRNERATLASVWKMITGTARCDVGAPAGFFVMMYCALRPLSVMTSPPMKAPNRRAHVVAHDLRSPYSSSDLLIVVASEM